MNAQRSNRYTVSVIIRQQAIITAIYFVFILFILLTWWNWGAGPLEIHFISALIVLGVTFVFYYSPISDLNDFMRDYQGYPFQYQDGEACIQKAKDDFYKHAFLWGFLAYMGWVPLPRYLTRKIDELRAEMCRIEEQKLRSRIAKAGEKAGQGELDIEFLETLYGSELIKDWKQSIQIILDSFHSYIERQRKETSQPFLKYVSQAHKVLERESELFREGLRLVLFADGESAQEIADNLGRRFEQASELARKCEILLNDASVAILKLFKDGDYRSCELVAFEELSLLSTQLKAVQVYLDQAIGHLDKAKGILSSP